MPSQAKEHGPTVTRVTGAPSKSVRSMRHDTRCSPHQFAYRPRQGRGPGTLRLLAMSDFVVAHGLDNGPAAQVVGRQLFEVALQMTFHLALGLGHEPQARPVP